MPVEEDPKRNEEHPAFGAGNRFPDGEPLDPSRFGGAGIRTIMDDLIHSFHGRGKPQLEALGHSFREVAEHRELIEQALASIVRTEGRRPQRLQARAAALHLLGHLRAEGEAPLCIEVASAVHEPPNVRVAAVDALRLMRHAKAERALQAILETTHHASLAHAAIVALGRIGSDRSIPTLERAQLRSTHAPAQRSIEATLALLQGREAAPAAARDAEKPKARSVEHTAPVSLDAPPLE